MVQLCSFSSYLLTCGRSSPEPALLLLVLPALEQSQQLRKFHVKLLMQEQNFRVRQDCPVSRQGAGTALPFTPAVPPVAPSELHGTPETPTREAEEHQTPRGLTWTVAVWSLGLELKPGEAPTGNQVQ